MSMFHPADSETCARAAGDSIAQSKKEDMMGGPFYPDPKRLRLDAAVPDWRDLNAALMRFLAANPGATENDWYCATDELRRNYLAEVWPALTPQHPSLWRSLASFTVYAAAVSPLLLLAGLEALADALVRSRPTQRYLAATDRLHWRLKAWVAGGR